MSIENRPKIEGVHHFSPTVTDIDRSIEWYQRVFGLERVPVKFPHYEDEDAGYAVLLTDPHSEIAFGLHHHDGNSGESFDERRTGLDHIAFSVAGLDELTSWAAWLDELGVDRSPITELNEPFHYYVLVFRDPDNIQLELFALV
ncbi:VOC family protein [Amycolatopsis acidiphila]|uniref:VOC family protein n=1 Tax=Amycolatopsis acidiphila TaxID=715473 RepID=A0A558ADQ8_9PSEU|nr:VOC family protein [Amycolatopsis acidiphila]TVT22391.1 VOC family protein [Amycolatopsis acidiphila]UIJ57589.1 VOC family protein [Amycolatopsis acidiphila]GHG89668.1 glyoxalase [Amycolatopsis acidiphila]